MADLLQINRTDTVMTEGFYVTVRAGKRWAPLLGPYDTHQEALDNVDRSRTYVLQNWTDGCWWEYGTTRIVTSAKPLRAGKLNNLIGLTAVIDADVDPRQLRAWTGALDFAAVTGVRFEQAANTAEQPDRVVWDRVRPDGSLHLPWVTVHTTPCPGKPWVTEPDRWNGSMYCGMKHWHTRASLGIEDARK